jgi:hypothetical protein
MHAARHPEEPAAAHKGVRRLKKGKPESTAEGKFLPTFAFRARSLTCS